MPDTGPLWLSLALALATTAILLVLATPLAWWLATTRSRAKPYLEAVTALPLVLPPTVMGFYLLLAFNPSSPIGAFWIAVTGDTLAFSFAGILAASVLYNLPFAVRPFASGFAAVDPRLIEAARCLGASGPRTFVTIVLPLSWPAVLAGVVLPFAHTAGEFGVVLMVGGNIPGVTRTIALAIYDDVQALDYASANEASLVLLVFAFVVLAVTYSLQRRFVPL